MRINIKINGSKKINHDNRRYPALQRVLSTQVQKTTYRNLTTKTPRVLVTIHS